MAISFPVKFIQRAAAHLLVSQKFFNGDGSAKSPGARRANPEE
jgi:hypothetical protein